MQTVFHAALGELYKNNTEVISMAFVEWWLLKYDDLFINRSRELPYLDGFEDKDGKYAFFDAYYNLNCLSETHRFESVCQEALSRFNNLKSTTFSSGNIPLLEWIFHYKKLCSEKLIDFVTGYYYAKDDSHRNLSVYHVNVRISKQDFQNIISFVELFDQVYWQNSDVIDVELSLPVWLSH